MVLMYSLVARGSEILLDASHPLNTGNFRQVSYKLLQRVENQSIRDVDHSEDADGQINDVEKQKDKQTLLFEGHLFHFIHRGSFWFMVMTDRSSGQIKPFNFLRDAIDTYMRATNDGVTRLEGSSAKALNEALTLKLETFSNQSDEEKRLTGSQSIKSATQRDEDDTDQLLDPSRSRKPSDGDSILANTRRDLATVKNGILNNLDRVMSRGEALETLVDRSDELNNSASEFKSQSTRLRRTLCLSNARAIITLGVLALLTIYGVAAFKCGVALNHCNT